MLSTSHYLDTGVYNATPGLFPVSLHRTNKIEPMPLEVVFKLSFLCSYEHWLAFLFKSKKKQCQCQIVMWETVWCSRCELICRTASLVQSSKWFPAGQSSAHLPNLITILSPRASWAIDSLKKLLRYKFRNKIKVLQRHFHKHIRQWKGAPHANSASK